MSETRSGASPARPLRFDSLPGVCGFGSTCFQKQVMARFEAWKAAALAEAVLVTLTALAQETRADTLHWMKLG